MGMINHNNGLTTQLLNHLTMSELVKDSGTGAIVQDLLRISDFYAVRPSGLYREQMQYE